MNTASRALAVVVGRGQSKRLPGKALRSLGGHPLIGWTARAAAASGVDTAIVSSDDAEIAATAERYGVQRPYLRPAELAADDTPNDRVLAHAVKWMREHRGVEYEIAVLVQSAAPFVRPEDIDACIANLRDSEASCCFTVTEAPVRPEGMFRVGDDGYAAPVIPGPWTGADRKKHTLPPAYQPNGAVWAVKSAAFLSAGALYCPPFRVVPMARERSVDIDFEYDLAVAEALAGALDIRIAAIPPKPETTKPCNP